MTINNSKMCYNSIALYKITPTSLNHHGILLRVWHFYDSITTTGKTKFQTQEEL